MTKNGFTLVEVVVVLVISLMLAAMVGNNLSDFFKSAVIDSEVENISSSLRLAKSKAISGVGESKYTAVFEANRVVIQNEQAEEVDAKYFDGRVSVVASPSSIEFERLSGETSSCSDLCEIVVSYTATGGNPSQTITVSAQGVIDVE